MFCDEKCREESMKRFHAIECEFQDTFLEAIYAFIKPSFMALRMLMIATDQGKKLIDLFRDPDFGTPFPTSELRTYNEPFDSENYKFVHNLRDNMLTKIDDFALMCSGSVLSVLVTHFLKQTTFFDHAKEQLNENTSVRS